jgi:hypothetical protein
MSNYGLDYFSLILEGLQKTVVTDGKGKEISLEEGLEIWAKKSVRC